MTVAMRAWVSLLVAALAGALAPIAAWSCAPRPRMCAASSECMGTASCVAGRCQANDAGVPAIAEQSDAGPLVRRLVLAPSDVAWLRRGDDARAAASMPGLFTLGRQGDGDALLLARFSVPLAKDAKIVEAYLLLVRSDAVYSDPVPVSLHAARIVDPWESRSLRWATQPRLEDVRSPATRVDPGGREVTRLDVRSIVQRWALHDPRDQGIAVLADSTSPTGVPFAFLPAFAGRPAPGAAPASGPGFVLFPASGMVERPFSAAAPPPAEPPTVELMSPRLELYVK